MADDLEYLYSDFDLNTLTVPKLRAILVSHDVPYPASAKKAQLIRILQDEVLPRARKLLRERDRVRRTSEGITDFNTRHGPDDDVDDDNVDGVSLTSRETSVVGDTASISGNMNTHRNRLSALPPTPGTRSTRSRQSSARPSTADTDEIAHRSFSSVLPSAGHHGRRRTTPAAAATLLATTPSMGKHPRASDTEETGDDARSTPVITDGATPRQSAARKLRRSDAIPSTEPPSYETPRPAIKMGSRHDDDGIFTDENPFQSGSSPIVSTGWEHERPSTISRAEKHRRQQSSRFSPSEISALKKREPHLRARKSDRASPIIVTPTNAPSRSTFDFAPSQSKTTPDIDHSESESDDSVVEGEEFTPEEQLALENAQAHLMYSPSSTGLQRRRKQGAISRIAPWVVIFSLLGSFGAWWRQEKIDVGFCGVGKPSWSLAETKVPDWVNVIEPHCEPCPPHAFCYPNFEARCEQDFILKPHPLSLWGLIPLPPTCEADSDKARRVKAVADKAVDELRERRAKWECGSKEKKSLEITEPELKQEIAKKRRKGMSDAEFEDLWKGAIGEIVGREEITSKTRQPSGVLVFTSTSFARLPLACAFRRYVRLSLLAYRLPVLFLILFSIILIYIRSRVLARRSDIARVPELVSTTLDRLATQAALHACGKARESYIPIGQLRDDVLRSELHGKRREELWKRVRSFVEGNANVRAAVREGRGGDVARVWEWIGGISYLDAGREGGSGSGQRTRLRQDGTDGVLRPLPSEDLGPIAAGVDKTNGDQPHESASASLSSFKDGLRNAPRKWDEGRPVY